jgi:hypothetical protein
MIGRPEHHGVDDILIRNVDTGREQVVITPCGFPDGEPEFPATPVLSPNSHRSLSCGTIVTTRQSGYHGNLDRPATGGSRVASPTTPSRPMDAHLVTGCQMPENFELAPLWPRLFER